MKKLKLISLNFLIFGLLVLSLEAFLGILIFVRRRANIGGEKVYKLKFEISGTTGHKHLLKNLDWETGYDDKTADFSSKSIINCSLENCETKNILTLGGSTTDPFGRRYSSLGGTWPELLVSKLSKGVNSNINLFNYGQGGFTTSQELISLIKAKSKHNLNIAISFNGVNEYYFLRNNKIINDQITEFESDMLIKSYKTNNPILFFNNSRFRKCNKFCFDLNSNYKSNIYKALDFLNTKKLIRQRAKENKTILSSIDQNKYDMKVYKRVADIYERNLNDMNNLAVNNQINYFAFLQPTMIIDDLKAFKPNAKNITIYDYLNKKYPNENKLVKLRLSNQPEYLFAISKLYKELKIRCKKLSFCYDLTNFDSSEKSNLFYDPRHFNKLGNELISEKIMKIIKTKFDN